MREVFVLQDSKFGEFTRALNNAAEELGSAGNLFRGLNRTLNRALQEGRDKQAHKLLAKVVYELYDALKVFESRLSYFKSDPLTIHELRDGTRAVQFRMATQLDRSVLRLRDLFHVLLKQVLAFDIPRAQGTIVMIEDFLIDQQTFIEHNAIELRRAA